MHTPGPWFTEPLSTIGHCAIVDAEGFTIANPSPMGQDNARLIAAAPDMLAALQLIHANAGESPEWIRSRIDAVIARATGGQ